MLMRRKYLERNGSLISQASSCFLAPPPQVDLTTEREDPCPTSRRLCISTTTHPTNPLKATMDESDDSPKYVKLISATGTEVFCERSIAISASATMAAMLTSSMREAEENIVRLPDISGPILEKVVQVRAKVDAGGINNMFWNF